MKKAILMGLITLFVIFISGCGEEVKQTMVNTKEGVKEEVIKEAMDMVRNKVTEAIEKTKETSVQQGIVAGQENVIDIIIPVDEPIPSLEEVTESDINPYEETPSAVETEP